MSTDRNPDRGDIESSRPAVWEVEDIAGQLWESKLEVRRAVDQVSAEAWSGQGAQAFLDTATTIEQSAQSTCDGWVRLSIAMNDYLNQLQDLQNEGDTIRLKLSNAEQDLADAQADLEAAREGLAPGESLSLEELNRLTEACREANNRVQWRLNELASMDDDRRRLNARAVEALEQAPGPGAQAWSGLAYQSNGVPRPKHLVLADVLAVAQGEHLSSDDYALLDQFFAMYSADEKVMADFYAGLGPEGVDLLLAGMSTTSVSYQQAGVKTLPMRLRAGLVTASLTWDDQTATEWGEGLIRLIEDADLGALGQTRVLVSWLLEADGLNPEVAMGALDYAEELRLARPDSFARIAPDDDLFAGNARTDCEKFPTIFGRPVTDPPDLMGAVFAQLTQIPSLTREWFTEREDATQYWFGERNWDNDRYEGPAALLDAITNDPEALAGRLSEPVSQEWVETVAFCSLAYERLGGNLNLNVGDMSTQASLDIVEAVGTFAPEIAAGFGAGADTSGRGDDTVTILIDGRMVDVPALTTPWGNLLRLIGMATCDPTGAAAAAFQQKVGDHANTVLDYVTGPGHPDLDTAKDLMFGLGGLYGTAYAAGAYEMTKRTEVISDHTREVFDMISAISGLIPGVKTGSEAADYLAGVVIGNGADLASALDPSVVSEAELKATIDAGLKNGNAMLTDTVSDNLESRWPDDYDSSHQTLVNRLDDGYAFMGGAATNDISTGDLDVTVIEPGGVLDSRSRGEMP